ncbi:MAG TPA: response regulator [Planctomycetota bacterium]|nr:response regulator [Planctomycetota bacterium]
MPERRRILVVDDNNDTVDVLCQTLSARGYTAIPARSGAEALQKARTDVLDCVLLDIMMPECDGLKVCRELKSEEATKRLPVIILSARNDPEMMAEAKALGADCYLVKPTGATKLLQAIEMYSMRNNPESLAVPAQAVIFITRDTALASGTQSTFDAGRVGGREWLRIVAFPNCERAKAAIENADPRAVVIDSRYVGKDAAALCRQIKLTTATKHVAVIVLLENAADDTKFAWANECLVDPVHAQELAETIKRHLRMRPV